MESQRTLLVIALAFVSFLLFQQWMIDTSPQPVNPVASTDTQIVDAADTDVPASASNQEAPTADASQSQLIEVKTDVLTLTINTQGGDILSALLNEHALELDSEERFQLLENSRTKTYVAQSGLIGRNGPDGNPDGRPVYSTDGKSFILEDGQDELIVPLTYTDANGAVFTTIFTFKRGSYDINVSYNVQNSSDSPLQLQQYGQLKQTVNIPQKSSGMMMSAYRGPAYSSDSERYTKYSFDDMKKGNLNILTQGGWAGMLEHYFVSAWIPSEQEQNQIYSRMLNSVGEGIVGFKGPVVDVPAGQSAELSADLWVGPKLQKEMAEAGKHLDLTVDYGWLWFIAQPLFKLLNFFHSIVGNWGLAIILITFTVRGAMYPLTKAQYTSMAKMRMLQPKLTQMKERYGDDRQKMSQAMMELYKKEKVNPLGGCLPLLLQMPIFIALYWALMESVELRHAPFMLWLDDLSAKDPYFILPILMGASMFLIQKMSPTTVTDPMQQKIMTYMPVMFTFFFLWFPSGLVLYWLVSNIVTIIQQTLIYRGLEKQGLHSRDKK